MDGDRTWQSRYPAVRSRVFYWVLTAPLLILYGAMVIAIDTTADSLSIGWKIVVMLPLLIILAFALRTIFGWDLIVTEDQLVYRSTFRDLKVPRSQVDAATVDEGRSSVGAQNLVILNLHLSDSTRVPLKLFNSFRPKPESPKPLGFQRLTQMASELNAWAMASRAAEM